MLEGLFRVSQVDFISSEAKSGIQGISESFVWFWLEETLKLTQCHGKGHLPVSSSSLAQDTSRDGATSLSTCARGCPPSQGRIYFLYNIIFCLIFPGEGLGAAKLCASPGCVCMCCVWGTPECPWNPLAGDRAIARVPVVPWLLLLLWWEMCISPGSPLSSC